MLFGFIDKMDTLKIFGLEAKLRKTILEADETLERLKGILRPLSEMVFARSTGRPVGQLDPEEGST